MVWKQEAGVFEGAYFGSLDVREAVAKRVEETHKPFHEPCELDSLFHAFRIQQGAFDEI